MLIAPSEPTILKQLGEVSSYPERHGVDVLFDVGDMVVGIQRKEVKDLLASLHDGRLSYEIKQISTSSVVTNAYLLIEGIMQWTNEGQLNKEYGSEYTIAQHNGLLLSLASNSISTVYSPALHLTPTVISSLQTYLSKPRHSSLLARPKATGKWGSPTNLEFLTHLLQSFPGLGYEKGKAIVEKWGVPLKWVLTVEQLADTPGVGIKTAKRLHDSLRRKDDFI